MPNCCSIRGCGNSDARLKQWREKFCALHNINFGIAHCICDPPFRLFNFPTVTRDAEGRKRWTKLMNRPADPLTGKDWQPTKNHGVCSRHFVDGFPTSCHPDPVLDLDLPTRPNCRIYQAVQPSFIVFSSSGQPSSSSRQVIKYTSALKAAYQSRVAAPESAEANRSGPPHVKTRVIVIQPIDEKEDLDDGLLSGKHIAATRCEHNYCESNEVFSDAVLPDVKLENELQQTEETYKAKKCKFSDSSSGHSYEELRNQFEDTKKDEDRLSEACEQHFETEFSETSQLAKGFVALPPASAVKSLNDESAYDIVKTEKIESAYEEANSEKTVIMAIGEVTQMITELKEEIPKQKLKRPNSDVVLK